MSERGSDRIGLVCLGNICRSPMAHVVLAAKLAAAGLSDRVIVRSCGTGDWHVGDPMDPRAAATLRDAGYDGSGHRAQQFDPTWFDRFDLLLAMDESNLGTLHRMARDDSDRDRVRLFRAYDPAASDGDRSVPDPWYGGGDGFVDVLAMVERTADELVATLAQQA